MQLNCKGIIKAQIHDIGKKIQDKKSNIGDLHSETNIRYTDNQQMKYRAKKMRMKQGHRKTP